MSLMKLFATVPVLCTALLGLTACKSVSDYSVPLPTPFLTNSVQYELKQPSSVFGDSYAQQSGPFAISRVDISWLSTTKHSLTPGGNALEKVVYELFSDEDPEVQHYKVRQKREYQFHSSDGAQSIKVECQLKNESLLQETVRPQQEKTAGVEQNNHHARELDRQQTRLSCVLQQADRQWQLTVALTEQQQPILTLQSGSDVYPLTAIHHGVEKVDNQWRQLPDFASNFQGLHISNGGQMVAAMSFPGQTPKIWLSRNLAPAQQHLLFAASYSLQLLNWLDQDWRPDQQQMSQHWQ
jgi:hypothetical protein